ncbi:MAG: FAD:protein FMN transferase [Methylococcales bacterium]
MIFSLAGCSQPEPLQSLGGFAQGTTWQVRFWSHEKPDPALVRRFIETEFSRLDQVLSNYRPDSVIETFNSRDDTDARTVGPEIVALIQQARIVSEASSGCYDLTIKSLFDLWGFNGETLTPPDDTKLQHTLARTGFQKLQILAPDRLRKLEPAVRVDLSSIAQGYSVQRIAGVLESRGIHHYLVEIGGELQIKGHKPDGSAWRIGIERPWSGERSLEKTLIIQRDAPTAVMTSGTYRRFFDIQGRRYSHILDARTGRTVAHNTVSVTVVHDDASQADAWSTALLCLGKGDGLNTANQTGIAALFIVESQGRFEEHSSAAWQSLQYMAVQ